MNKFSKLQTIIFALLILFSSNAFATNGMDLEGYGPVSTGMGGTSQAFDNGTAAMTNNPATLILQTEKNRLDMALGALIPSLSYTPRGMTTESDGKLSIFYMPAVGYTRSLMDGDLVVGFGFMAQGGMGANYEDRLDFTDQVFADSNDDKSGTYQSFSSVAYMKAMVPIVYKVNNWISVGVSPSFGFAMMQMQMIMPGQSMGQMMSGSARNYNIPELMGMSFDHFLLSKTDLDLPNGDKMPLPAAKDYGMNEGYVNYGYVDIKDEGDTAMGYGFGGKIGVLLTPMSNMKIGLSYSTPSYLNKLEGKTQMYMNAQNFSNGKNMVVPMKSDVAMDFQWPMSFAAGLSYNPLSNLTLAFDVNWLNWSATMDKMEFEFTNNEFMAEDFGVMKYTEIKGKFLFTMPQKWEDQLVFKVGAEYKMLDDNLSLRAGFNYGSNPVPDDYLNFLMGAVVTTHVTAGIGYNLLDWFSTDISYVYVPEAESGNPKTSGLYKMSENNIQFMVSSVF